MKKLRRVPRFDLLEVVLVVALVSTAAWKAGRTGAHQVSLEARPLEQKYGPAHNSEHEEEWIIRDFFNDRHGGYFVDVGANHYRHYSNTYYLDAVLGWSGIAVEPQREFADGYVKNRPRTKFKALFVSDESNEQAKLFVLDKNTLVTSAREEFTSRYGRGVKEVPAITITLNDLSRCRASEVCGFYEHGHRTLGAKGALRFRYRAFQACTGVHRSAARSSAADTRLLCVA